MGIRRIAIVGAAAAVAAGGAAAAIAGVGKDDGGKEVERAVIDDAAQRLGVSSTQLRTALADAEDAQLDRAVKDGDLTQKQADAMKRARQRSGRVLGFPGGPPCHGLGGPPGLGPDGPGGRGGPGGPLADVAKALGISTEKLFSRLRAGKTVAEVAKAQGKRLDDVKKAVRSASEARLDKAVEAGDLTRKQADATLEHLDEHLDRLASGRPFGPPRGARGRRDDRFGPPPAGDCGPPPAGDCGPPPGGDFGPPPGGDFGPPPGGDFGPPPGGHFDSPPGGHFDSPPSR